MQWKWRTEVVHNGEIHRLLRRSFRCASNFLRCWQGCRCSGKVAQHVKYEPHVENFAQHRGSFETLERRLEGILLSSRHIDM